MYSIEELRTIWTDKGIKITPEQLFVICNVLLKKAPCNLLVFGVGKDTDFWIANNVGGRTAFLENKQEWIDFTLEKSSDIEVYLVSYQTKRPEWRNLLDNAPQLVIGLPASIKDTLWDIIIIDAPKGHTDADPGRMQAIYTAATLINQPGDVFIHDTHREVEEAYCSKYLNQDNFVTKVEGFTKRGTLTALSHYKI